MFKKRVFAMMLVLSLLAVLAGCGASGAEETQAASGELGLKSWVMNATLWSSPNGATVNISATPNGYAEGQTADFIVRLEGEQVERAACQWNGSAYTASADLNAADGYCYYVELTGADGAVVEVPVNTPNVLVDESLINMASSLESYCSLVVESADTTGGKVTVTAGSAHIQLPRLTLEEGTVSAADMALVMYYNGEAVASRALTTTEATADGLVKLNIVGVSFPVPENMEDDQQLTIQLEATLSNGQTLTALGGTWYYLDGNLVIAAG